MDHVLKASLLTDAKAEEMAFPCLFPNGVNGLLTARDPAISITDYIQIRLFNADVDGLVTFPIYCGDAVCIAMRIWSYSGVGNLETIYIRHDQQVIY